MYNGTAMQSGSSGSLTFANCLISDNTTAYNIMTGGTMAGTNPGTSLITSGQTLTGSLSTPIALQ